MTFDARLDSAAVLFDHSVGDAGGTVPPPPRSLPRIRASGTS